MKFNLNHFAVLWMNLFKYSCVSQLWLQFGGLEVPDICPGIIFIMYKLSLHNFEL